MFTTIMALAAGASGLNVCEVQHLNPAALENIAVVAIPRMSQPQAVAVAQTALQQGDVESARNSLNALVEPLPSGGKVLGYTRLRMEFTPCGTKQLRRYAQESRSPLERFFVGKTDNQVLKFDAALEPLGVKATIQLYSLLRNSAKDGQSWTTDIRNDDYLLPYFRVDSASVLNFSANFQSEGSSKVEIGSRLLEIVSHGSSLIAPSALLITDDNKPRFNAAAEFVDRSLSQLFNKKVTETARQGIPISPTKEARQHLATLILFAPHPIKTYSTTNVPGRYIGQWDIYAEQLKESMFAEVTGNQADVTNLDPASVLNFKIGDKEVLRDRLASSEGIGKAAKALAQAAEGAVGEPAVGFCRLVAMESARVGLAPYDTAIATWAYLEDQGMVGAKETNARQACTPILRTLKLPS